MRREISWHFGSECDMMTSSNGNIFALLALCAGNSPVTSKFPPQRPVTRSFDIFFDLRLNKWLSKQSWGWWFETPSRSLWSRCDGKGGYETGISCISCWSCINICWFISGACDGVRQNNRQNCWTNLYTNGRTETRIQCALDISHSFLLE